MSALLLPCLRLLFSVEHDKSNYTFKLRYTILSPSFFFPSRHRFYALHFFPLYIYIPPSLSEFPNFSLPAYTIFLPFPDPALPRPPSPWICKKKFTQRERKTDVRFRFCPGSFTSFLALLRFSLSPIAFFTAITLRIQTVDACSFFLPTHLCFNRRFVRVSRGFIGVVSPLIRFEGFLTSVIDTCMCARVCVQ